MADMQGFDATKVDPSTPFDVLPAGKYLAAITESEKCRTKNNDGSYLKFKFQILDGPQKGRVLFKQITRENKNAQAVKIGDSDLSAICHAVKVLKANDTQQLHNLPLVIDVKCKKRADTGEIGNEIKGFESKDGNKQAAGVAPQSSTADSGAAPWKR